MTDSHPTNLFQAGFTSRTLQFSPFWRIRISLPEADFDRVFNTIIAITPLQYGKTDHNASRSASGFEYYRPMADTPTGAESETRKRPGIVDMVFCIEPDHSLLERLVDTLYEYSSYYEPPISIEPILRSATIGLDDSDNPHRWWNTTGDWKADS